MSNLVSHKSTTTQIYGGTSQFVYCYIQQDWKLTGDKEMLPPITTTMLCYAMLCLGLRWAVSCYVGLSCPTLHYPFQSLVFFSSLWSLLHSPSSVSAFASLVIIALLPVSFSKRVGMTLYDDGSQKNEHENVDRDGRWRWEQHLFTCEIRAARLRSSRLCHPSTEVSQFW